MTLRLVDDIPMLQYTLEYGLGSKVCLFSKNISVAIHSTFGRFLGTRQDPLYTRINREHCRSHLLSGGENMLAGRT